MHDSLRSQLDGLGVGQDFYWVDRARRMLEVGKEHLFKFQRPWSPLLPRHEFEAMMRVPEAKAILREVKDLFLNKKFVRERVVKRRPIPEVLDPEDQYYMKQVMHYKYVRDLLLSTGQSRLVVDYKEYYVYDLEDLNKLVRPWFNDQWDRCKRATYFQ